MSLPAASVIVVSRHRAAALARCLTGLAQQDHPLFEVVVVADPEAAGQVQAAGWTVKLCIFDRPNISAARNAGLALAAAPVVAFIDDDSVPEPTWLSRLVAPFADPAVVAATGFVRGRNGISFQWRTVEVDALAQDHPLAVAGPVLRAGTAQRAVKTQGTNCAFRRASVLAVGGFDPAYAFFLDEADLNLRLAPLGLTAVVPGAEVHHGYLASPRRRADRLPLDLTDIAASTAIFLRRHAGAADPAGWTRLAEQQGARLAGLRRAGRLSRAQEAGLLAGLSAGWAEGCARSLPPLPALPDQPPLLQPLPATGARAGIVLAGRFWQRRSLQAAARQAVAEGRIATVICLSPTARAHRVAFQPEGYWLQSGGLFGRAERDAPRVRLWRFARRLQEELKRIQTVRPIDAGPAACYPPAAESV